MEIEIHLIWYLISSVGRGSNLDLIFLGIISIFFKTVYRVILESFKKWRQTEELKRKE